MTPARLVVAAAIVDDLHAPTRLLAARRAYPEHLVGRWEFPGGKVEPDETPEAGLHRELAEELGIVVELGDEVVPAVGGAWTITDRHVMRLWLARVTEGEPSPADAHDEVRWLSSAERFSVPWLDADVPIVDAVVDRPEFLAG
ncbi:DNA mismatch repair protein MutT [Paraoerskovia sediminicola]|uniref:8-oxo-dGTP diphosphatase n=1 Tax=Paraoerskovia sediminicola TaxID=1138587 RepID=A0ABN6XEG2_9CELL|nr:(deoxy)nucleoside triphosphate pyrophosphohydrolase [Paraoerskovia sediminicola]BDZ42165.1 DNA mismatch repair protein MutT [Paraoerskovia sediminicola]